MLKLENAVIVVISILILATFGLGADSTYSDNFYNPNRGFSTLIATSSGFYDEVAPPPLPGQGTVIMGTKRAKTHEKIDEWAKAVGATVFCKGNGSTAGCGFVGYSDWIKSEQ